MYRNFLLNVENLLSLKKFSYIDSFWMRADDVKLETCFGFHFKLNGKPYPIQSNLWVHFTIWTNIKLNDILNWGEVVVFSTLDMLNEMAIKTTHLYNSPPISVAFTWKIGCMWSKSNSRVFSVLCCCWYFLWACRIYHSNYVSIEVNLLLNLLHKKLHMQ